MPRLSPEERKKRKRDYNKRPEVREKRNKWFKEYQKQYRKDNNENYIVMKTRERAKKAGIPHDITKDDIVIPDVCPVLGIEIKPSDGKASPNSPSLDRLVPELGYVKGNVQVISHRANFLKNNGTPDELMAVAEWVKSQLSP